MKKIISLIAIILIAIILGKNYFLEHYIYNKALKQHINIKNINCKGLYNIDCKLSYIDLNISNTTTYNLKVKNVTLSNVLNIYLNKNKSKNYADFSIYINNLIIDDNRSVFKEINKPIKVNINVIDSNPKVSLKTKDIDINITKIKPYIYTISTNIVNDSIKKDLYELYKLKYLETKEVDGDAIAKGINISFGFNTNKVIAQQQFLKQALPRMVDLIISELESYDVYNKYNYKGNLSKVISAILQQNGKKTYNLILK